MSNGLFKVPAAKNEPIFDYAPGSVERAALKDALKEARSKEIEVPMVIDGKEITTENKVRMFPPHDIAHTLGYYSKGDGSHVKMAIEAALAAKTRWENTSWEHRASIFLKAADLLTGKYRYIMNAATMLAQSKTAFQAEIDAACELADFFRFNVQYMTDIYAAQPESSDGIWNRVEQRPLEGFIFALTPFNFTSIAGNLPSAPALMGNTVVWKVSNTQVYSAKVIMDIFREAGVPDGVINLVFVSGPAAAKEIFTHPSFAGIHFTGSTNVFNTVWKTIADNVQNYKTYPRIVGETGGKNYVFMHNTAGAKEVATALVRGAYEYQGQKCSAASRAYIPASRWDEVKTELLAQLGEVKMGDPADFTNFLNAVIDEASFDKLAGFIDRAKEDAEIIAGGGYDKSIGYFIEPTVILAHDPEYITMKEELFGPVLTIFVYDDTKMDEALDLLDKASIYGLTGAIFSNDRYVIEEMTQRLAGSAGNYYINDKPTGAVVGQQPFGGSRASGTNDKAGSAINLMRWVSPRTIKETFSPATHFAYTFMNEK